METDKNDLHKDWIKIAWHSLQEIMNCKNLKVCNKCFSLVEYLKEHIEKPSWVVVLVLALAAVFLELGRKVMETVSWISGIFRLCKIDMV